jgi:hypothetical protein
LAFSIDEKHLTARATGIARGMALLATVELSEMCSMILSFLIESPLFWSGRLSLKELGQLAGGIHHNAVGIAIRRFTQRLQSDRTLLEKVSLVQKELEPR